jgi:hypothetical protein
VVTYRESYPQGGYIAMSLSRKLAALCAAHFVFCLSIVGATAQEADRTWTKYATDNKEVEYSFDRDAVARPDKDILHVWRKRAFPQRSPMKEIVALDEFNCRLQQYRALELHVTGWDGNTRISNKVGPWTPIWADSPEEYFLDKVCKEKPPQP